MSKCARNNLEDCWAAVCVCGELWDSNPDGIKPGAESPVRMDPGTGAWNAPDPDDAAGVNLSGEGQS